MHSVRSHCLRWIVLLSVYAVCVHAAAQSPNDLFRSIAETVPKPPEEPVCCLRPLPPLGPTLDGEELLLSFEEWKQRAASSPSPSPPPPLSSITDAELSPPSALPISPAPSDEVSFAPSDDAHLSPHFLVPLTDRFNFASTDCSARVHTQHKLARGASSILSAKRDRYMLSPCAAPGQFVVVELCDDVRIDTVQLATFEFFSGVFRDVRISVARTYESDPAAWTVVDTYRAKNRRGVQSFHPPTAFGGFWRYIRIDLLSHYGAEYYCPLSLLRVYGLTHLDEWKWEVWAAESRAKQEQVIPVIKAVVETMVVEESTLAGSTTEAAPTHSAEAILTSSSSSRASQVHLTTNAPSEGSAARTSVSDSKTATEVVTRTTSFGLPSTASFAHASPSTDSSGHSPPDSARNTNSSSILMTASASSSTKSITTTTTVLSSALAPLVVVSPPSVPPTAPTGAGGESIYRVIMHRLSALEGNATLHARFVDAHAAGTREALRRVAEDVGRLRQHAADAERERRRAERAHARLAGQLAALAQDVREERRLGVAQLVLVLAVLVFLGLTRGGAPPPAAAPRAHARNRSLGADLFARLRTRSMTIPNPPARKTSPLAHSPDADGTPSPTLVGPSSPPARPGFPRRMSDSQRPRVANASRRPLTPAAFVVPRGHAGTPPRSARHWARTAHLHELRVRSKSSGPRGERGRENASPTRTPVLGLGMMGKEEGKRRVPLGPLRIEVPSMKSVDGEGETWVDTDVEGEDDDEGVSRSEL